MALTWPSLNFCGFCGITASSSFCICDFLPDGFGSNCFSRFRSAPIVSSRSLSILMYGVEMGLCKCRDSTLYAERQLIHEWRTADTTFNQIHTDECFALQYSIILFAASSSLTVAQCSITESSSLFGMFYRKLPHCTWLYFRHSFASITFCFFSSQMFAAK